MSEQARSADEPPFGSHQDGWAQSRSPWTGAFLVTFAANDQGPLLVGRQAKEPGRHWGPFVVAASSPPQEQVEQSIVWDPRGPVGKVRVLTALEVRRCQGRFRSCWIKAGPSRRSLWMETGQWAAKWRRLCWSWRATWSTRRGGRLAVVATTWGTSTWRRCSNGFVDGDEAFFREGTIQATDDGRP